MTKVTPEPPPTPAVCKERPEGWWKEPPFSEWVTDRGREPTTYELYLDYILGRVMASPRALEIASTPPTRLIQYEIVHPKRGVEYVRLHMNPTDVMEGPAEEEPDIIIRMGYYDLLAIFAGEITVFNAIYEGRAEQIGNVTAGLDQFDISEATNGREPTPRPRCWPRGHP